MKVGDYIRTKYGIAKITKIDLDVNACEIDKRLNDFNFVLNENIIKLSSNIIDLIEKFDLVNGHLVICKKYEDEKDIPTIIKCVGDYYFKEEDIKSIVTKEQFERMEYKI